VTRLILCRHGDPASPHHANALARALRDVPLAGLYTSPLSRAAAAAAAIGEACGLSSIEVPDLREIDFGEVEGLRFEEFPPELQAGLLEQPTRVRFPGGETFQELQLRVVAALDAIVQHHVNATVVVVTHAGPIRAALAAWLLADDEAAFRIDQRHGALNVIDWVDGVPFVRLVNARADQHPLRVEPDAPARRSMTD
jgi:broad specificity phosphatase PhoE